MAELTADDYKRAYEVYKNAGQIDKAKEIGRQFQVFQQQQRELQNQPVQYDPMKSLENFGPSLLNAGADLAHAVMSPIDTATAVGNLALSGAANLGQVGLDLADVDYQVPNQEAGEAFAGMLDERYGSMDALKTTAMNDPAGLLMDLSSVFTGGGTAAAKTGGKIGKAGEAIAKVGAALDPLTGVVKAPVAAIEASTGQPLSRQLYQSAMKPSTTIAKNQRVELLDAGLELGATPTIRSQNKIESQKQAVYDNIESLENSVDASVMADSGRLFEHVGDVRRDYNPPILNSAEALAAIDKVVDAQLEALYLNGSQPLTVKDLSRIKRHIYNNVSYDKRLANRNIDKPSEETMKAIARSAKEQIEEIIPEIKGLNAEYGKITNVQNKIQNPAAARIGNRDLIGIGAPMKAGVGGVVDGGSGAVIGAGVGMLDAPVTKSNLAIATNRAGKVVRSPNNPFKTASLAGRYEQAVLADEQEREREKQKRELRRKD